MHMTPAPRSTVTVPPFLTEADFHNPAIAWVDNLGPCVTLFVPTLEIGGWWLPSERRWLLQYPLSADELAAAVNKWLVASGQMGAAVRHCRAAGTLPPEQAH